jgi:insulysin
MEASCDIIKPKVDARVYKVIKLPNELRCLLIHDPEATKSAASLDVNVGSSLDPKAQQGLAHFLEHMLFMGTTKYPDENEYSDFI